MRKLLIALLIALSIAPVPILPGPDVVDPTVYAAECAPDAHVLRIDSTTVIGQNSVTDYCVLCGKLCSIDTSKVDTNVALPYQY